MNPRLAVDDLMDGPPVNAILACELALAGGSRRMGGTNSKNLRFGQSGAGMFFAASSWPHYAPALVYHVGYVVFGRAEE